MLLTQTALDHLPLGHRTIRPMADGTAEPLVPLLVTRIAHRVMLMPSTGRASARRTRSTVHAHATTAALPANLGHGRHHWPDTLRVIRFVAMLAEDDPLVGVSGRNRCRGVFPANMALPASRALPPSPHTGHLRQPHTDPVVVVATLAAHHQIRNVAGPSAGAAFNVLCVGTGVRHLVHVVPTEARIGLDTLEAPRGGHAREVKGIGAGHLAGQGGAESVAKCTFARQAGGDRRLKARKGAVGVARDVSRPIGAGPVHVKVLLVVEQGFQREIRFGVADLLQLVDVLGSTARGTPGGGRDRGD